MRSRKPFSKKHFNKSIVALSIGLALSGNALAQPTGMSVVHGQAAMETLNNLTTVTNTPGTIINWQQFNVGSGEVLKFIQDNASSQVFNRVTGGGASSILGSLQSNGQVFLINPGGVIVGQNAVINTAGFLASTLAISDKDLLAGKFAFNNDGNAQAITQAGSITAHSGGSVVLIAPNIENSGIIHADGDVLLAAGHAVTIVDLKHPTLGLTIDVAEGEEAVNLSEIVGKNVSVFASLVKNHGVVEASSAELGEGGVIRFHGDKGVELGGQSVVNASAAAGGVVDVLAASGDALVSGSVVAEGGKGEGGDIKITGNRVAILRDANISADGQTGGGQVHIGGGWQGKDASVQNAKETVMQEGASVSASAGNRGDGGEIVVWSDGLTKVAGSLDAKGGQNAGNGGRIETSGKAKLQLGSPVVDTSSPTGKAGKWLLDPGNVTIVQGPSATESPTLFPDPSGSPNVFTSAGTTPDINGDTFINNTDIRDAFLTNNTVEIIATADSASGAAGDIFVNAPINVGFFTESATPNEESAKLVLRADGGVQINDYVGLADFNSTNEGNLLLGDIQDQFGSLSLDVFYDTLNSSFTVSDSLYIPYGTLSVFDIQTPTTLGTLTLDTTADVNVNGLIASSVVSTVPTSSLPGNVLGIEGTVNVSSIEVDYIELGDQASLTVGNLDANFVDGFSLLRSTGQTKANTLNVTNGNVIGIYDVTSVSIGGVFAADEAYLGNSLTVTSGAAASIGVLSGIPNQSETPPPDPSAGPPPPINLQLSSLIVDSGATLVAGSFAAENVIVNGTLANVGISSESVLYPLGYSTIGFEFDPNSQNAFFNTGTLTGTGSLQILGGEVKLGLSGFVDTPIFNPGSLPTLAVNDGAMVTFAGYVPSSVFLKLSYLAGGGISTEAGGGLNPNPPIIETLPVAVELPTGPMIGLHGVLDLQNDDGGPTQAILNDFGLVSLGLAFISNGKLGDGSLNGPGIFASPNNPIYLDNVGLQTTASVGPGSALTLSSTSYMNGAIVNLGGGAGLIQEGVAGGVATLGLAGSTGGVGTIFVSGTDNLIAAGTAGLAPSEVIPGTPVTLSIGPGIDIEVDNSAAVAPSLSTGTGYAVSLGTIPSLNLAQALDDAALYDVEFQTYTFGGPVCPCIYVFDSQSVNYDGFLFAPIDTALLPVTDPVAALPYVLFPQTLNLSPGAIQSTLGAEFVISGGTAGAPINVDFNQVKKTKPGRGLKIGAGSFVKLNSGTGGGVVNVTTPFNNQGSISLEGDFNFASGVVSSGTFDIGTANVKLGGSSSFDGAVSANGGMVEINGSVNFAGGFTSGGSNSQVVLGTSGSPSQIQGQLSFGSGTRVTGFANINGNVVAGSGSAIAVGASPGAMTVVGNFELQPGAVLEVEVADSLGQPGVGYDFINVQPDPNVTGSGNALLNGTISIIDLSTGTLATGATVPFIEAESISGSPTYTYSPASSSYTFTEPTVVTVTNPDFGTTRDQKQFTVQQASSAAPAPAPAPSPTAAPTTQPTTAPTAQPTQPPPTNSPTAQPTQPPSGQQPSPQPSPQPTQPPPTQQPTQLPPKTTTDVNQQLEVVYTESTTTQTKPLATQPPPPPPSDAPPPPPPDDGSQPPPPEDGAPPPSGDGSSPPPPPPDGGSPPPPPPRDPEEDKEAEELAKQSLNKPPISSQSKNIEVGSRPRPGPRPAAQCN